VDAHARLHRLPLRHQGIPYLVLTDDVHSVHHGDGDAVQRRGDGFERGVPAGEERRKPPVVAVSGGAVARTDAARVRDAEAHGAGVEVLEAEGGAPTDGNLEDVAVWYTSWSIATADDMYIG